jgi:hypothetical protein
VVFSPIRMPCSQLISWQSANEKQAQDFIT